MPEQKRQNKKTEQDGRLGNAIEKRWRNKKEEQKTPELSQNGTAEQDDATKRQKKTVEQDDRTKQQTQTAENVGTRRQNKTTD